MDWHHFGFFRMFFTEGGGVLQTNCSAPARKLKLDKFPGAKKILP